MSTEDADSGGGWASQDGEQDRGQRDRPDQPETVVYEGEDGRFKVQTIKPLVLLRNASQAGVLSLLSGDADDDAVEAAIASGGFDQFMETTIVPRVLKPDGAFWTLPTDEDGDPIPDPDGYDLAEMGGGMEDLFGLVEAMSGEEAADLQDMADDFQGNR